MYFRRARYHRRQPPPFTPLGAHGRDKLLEAGVKPSLLFQGKTIYQTLAQSPTPLIHLHPEYLRAQRVLIS